MTAASELYVRVCVDMALRGLDFVQVEHIGLPLAETEAALRRIAEVGKLTGAELTQLIDALASLGE